jgi:putative FmdB family regulatory protein
MPIYAFECAECGHAFDRLQKLSDPDPDACPSCGRPAVKRQLTAPAFRLAGGGKKDGDKKRNLAEGGSTSAASSSGDTAAPAKTESKPASTPSAG